MWTVGSQVCGGVSGPFAFDGITTMRNIGLRSMRSLCAHSGVGEGAASQKLALDPILFGYHGLGELQWATLHGAQRGGAETGRQKWKRPSSQGDLKSPHQVHTIAPRLRKPIAAQWRTSYICQASNIEKTDERQIIQVRLSRRLAMLRGRLSGARHMIYA